MVVTPLLIATEPPLKIAPVMFVDPVPDPNSTFPLGARTVPNHLLLLPPFPLLMLKA